MGRVTLIIWESVWWIRFIHPGRICPSGSESPVWYSWVSTAHGLQKERGKQTRITDLLKLGTQQEHLGMMQPGSKSRTSTFSGSWIFAKQNFYYFKFSMILARGRFGHKSVGWLWIVVSLWDVSTPLAWDTSSFSMVWGVLGAGCCCFAGRTGMLGYNWRAHQIAELLWTCGKSCPQSAGQLTNSWRTDQRLHLALGKGVRGGCSVV